MILKKLIEGGEICEIDIIFQNLKGYWDWNLQEL